MNDGLGSRIREMRRARGLTAEALAERCSINPTYLRQIEGGSKLPSLPVFIALCNALATSPDWLLRDALEDNEVTAIRQLEALWEGADPADRELAAALIRVVLERNKR